MKIFEFHFNPTAKKNTFFKTFASDSLYFVGELSNALPQNSQFLTSFSNRIKEVYNSSHHNLKETLQQLNAFLAGEIKKGNTDWVGNLHAALLTLSKKNGSSYTFSFAKTGHMQVLVSRHDAFIDLGKDVHDFKNFISGSLLIGDKVVVCTSDLFNVFMSQKFLEDIAFFKEEAQFKELFKTKEKVLSRVSGVLLSILIEAATSGAPVHFAPNFHFSLPRFRIPFYMPVLKIKLRFPAKFLAFSFNMKQPNWFSIFKNKKFLPLAAFIALLLVGFFLFKNERDASQRLNTETLARVKTLESQQQYFGAWQALEPLISHAVVPDEIVAVQKELEAKLKPIYFVEDIQNPKVAYEIKRNDTALIPHDIAVQGNYLYLSNSFSKQLFIGNLVSKKGKEFNAPANIKGSTAFENSVLFWSDPNVLMAATGEQLTTQTVSLPVQNFALDSMSSFGNNAYLFDSKQGQLIRIEDPTSANPVMIKWLYDGAIPQAQGTKSVAMDGGAWLLNKGKEIQRYYGGAYQQSFTPDIFPALSQATKLKTAPLFRYLYLLEPSQSRILLFTKAGVLAKQYESPAFNDATDFAVSNDEKTIFILAGSKIFKIER